MKPQTIGWTVALAALALTFATMPALARQGGPGGKEAPWARACPTMRTMHACPTMPMHMINNPEVQQELELTDQQIEQIKETTHQHAKKTLEQSSRIDQLTLDLRYQMRSDQPDRQAVMALVTEIGEIKIQQHKQAVERFFNLRQILSDEQRDALREHVRDRRPMTRRGRGQWGPDQENPDPQQPQPRRGMNRNRPGSDMGGHRMGR